MRVLVTGGTGLLGSYFIQGRPAEVEIASVQRSLSALPNDAGLDVYRADVGDKKGLEEVFDKWVPDAVVHTAGEGSVDKVERDVIGGHRSIVEATRVVADVCGNRGVLLVYLSSNAVFSGDDAPYGDEAMRSPRNEYGRLKAIAEDLVMASDSRNLVCRPILSFGWPLAGQRQNPVTWLIDELSQQRAVRVVSDVWENPIGSDSVARALWELIVTGQRGIFNIGGATRLSRFEFAQISAEVFGLDAGLIEAVGSSAFASIAPRPRDTTLDTAKLQRVTNWRPRSVREDLVAMKEANRA